MEIERFGRYRVVGRLGSGAMGDVYAAVDDALGRDVAIKTLRDVGVGLGARLLDARFQHEARAIAGLVHPSIVQVFDVAPDADPPYLVMERVAGPSVKEQLQAGVLAPEDVRQLGVQIGRALAAAHAAGVIHRDVKPANILVAGMGTWKLADFGVAHVPDSALTMTGQFVGTPAYAAPEALVRGTSGPAGDVYGLGATLYQAAAGRWPRFDDSMGALLAPVPPLGVVAPALPKQLAAAINRALAIEPGDRPTAAAFADVLASATSGPQVVVRRWRRWAIGVSAAVATLGGFAAVVGRGASLAATSGLLATPGPPPTPTPADHPASVVHAPASMDKKQSKDWQKILDQVSKGHYDDARHKLAEFENKYGASDQSRELAPRLDSLGPDVNPEPHGKHKGHGKDRGED